MVIRTCTMCPQSKAVGLIKDNDSFKEIHFKTIHFLKSTCLLKQVPKIELLY